MTVNYNQKLFIPFKGKQLTPEQITANLLAIQNYLNTWTPNVTQIIPGDNVTISPTDGVGDVTVNSSGGSEGPWHSGPGTNSAELAGESNNATGAASVVEGVSGYSVGEASHVEGSSGIAYGVRSHVEGLSCVAYGSQSHAEGTQSVATNQSEFTTGDNTNVQGQFSIVQASAITTDATPTVLQNGTTDGIYFNNGVSSYTSSTIHFVIYVVAQSADYASAWKIEGLIATGLRVVGVPTVTLIAQDAGASAWSVAFNLRYSTYLQVVVTGDSTQIGWTANYHCDIIL